MRYARLTIVAIQLSLATCYCQTRLELLDISPQTSPVNVSGTVSVSDDTSNGIRSYQVAGHFHNTSNKDIGLIIVHFASNYANGPTLSLTYQKEYFFSLNVLAKSGSEDFRSAVVRLRFGPTNDKVQQSPVDASGVRSSFAETVFVQFVDGTSWGDSESAQSALDERSETVRELSKLEAFLPDGGVMLKEELVNHGYTLSCINSLISDCSGKADSCLTEGVRSMIEAANRHQSGMKRESSTLVDEVR